MLEQNKKDLIKQIATNFSKNEILFSIGYLSALVEEDEKNNLIATNLQPNNQTKAINKKVNLLYVTETGNSKFLAGEIAKKLKTESVKSKTKDILQFDFDDLQKDEIFIFFVSTHGEGEIPDSGKKFYEFLSQNQEKYDKLNYAIIGLGDRNYQQFCQSAQDFDQILQQKSANRLFDNILLDVDFEDHIDDIAKNILVNISQTTNNKSEFVQSQNKAKKNYIGKIKNNIILNDEGSISQTHHIEIECEDEILYETGDAIAILFDKEKKNSPRLYSIASFAGDDENQVNILAKLVKYQKDDQEVLGLCTSYLANLKKGDEIEFYVAKNRQFKLCDDDKDIIMIGAGTGVAPFLGFIAERDFKGSSGKNWLFFGERNKQTDFYYQLNWQEYFDSGLLNRIDLAFSRDQEQKIYVQDKILAAKDEFFNWLENGAYIYICGDKENMAKSVEKTIKDILKEKLGEKSEQYWQKLIENERYLADIY